MTTTASAKMAIYETAQFWTNAPTYGTKAYWTMVATQPGTRDRVGRELVVTGLGAAGPIRCTRDYAQARLRGA